MALREDPATQPGRRLLHLDVGQMAPRSHLYRVSLHTLLRQDRPETSLGFESRLVKASISVRET